VWIYDAPLIFGLSSSIWTTVLYDGGAPYPRGVTAGPYCEYGNLNNGGWGTESFSYLGPAVPEPPAMAIGVLTAVSLASAARKRNP
jgi:hypothetical protein